MKKRFGSTIRSGLLASSKHSFLILLLLLVGCAGYESQIRKARGAFEDGNYELSETEIKKLLEKKDRNELLYLMDLGMVYHTAGKYDQAIKVFHEAEKLADIKDYTSLSAEVGSVILNDEVKSYTAEHFEIILIHTYLALDYTLLGRFEEALVECRRVNHILDKMISEGKLPYERNPFAKYVAALLFEAEREFNDAFVDYRALLKWGQENFPYLPAPLLRVSDKLKASQEFESYKKKYPETKDFRIEKGEGEIVLFLEQGRGPIKVPHPNFNLLPKFHKRYYESDFAWLREKSGKFKVRSYPLYDIEATAIKELDHRTAGIIAKKVGGVVVKQVIAAQVAKQTKSEELGFLTSLILHATDKADLRHWSTLPARLQLLRVKAPAGKYDLELDVQGSRGVHTAERTWQNIEVKAGRMTFLNYRTRN